MDLWGEGRSGFVAALALGSVLEISKVTRCSWTLASLPSKVFMVWSMAPSSVCLDAGSGMSSSQLVAASLAESMAVLAFSASLAKVLREMRSDPCALMLVIRKDMWSSILTERLHASSKDLCLLKAWGLKVEAAGGKLKLWDAWLSTAGGWPKLWDAWPGAGGGGIELWDAPDWRWPVVVTVCVVDMGVTEGFGFEGFTGRVAACAWGSWGGGWICEGRDDVLAGEGLAVGVEFRVEVTGRVGPDVKDAGGKESLKPGSKERTDNPEARRKAEARPLMLGEARLDMPDWSRATGVPGG